jgi:peptide/nickel transport system substrate-binding protein
LSQHWLPPRDRQVERKAARQSPKIQLIELQSSEAHQEKRKQLVWEIERKLAEDGARSIIFYGRRATC